MCSYSGTYCKSKTKRLHLYQLNDNARQFYNFGLIFGFNSLAYSKTKTKRPFLYQFNDNASHFFNFELIFGLKVGGLKQNSYFYNFGQIFGFNSWAYSKTKTKRLHLYQLNDNASHSYNFELIFGLKVGGLKQNSHFYNFGLVFGFKFMGLQQNQGKKTPLVSIEWQC